ncbi:MAG: HIRAN domain-containing protein [Anaerolineaceae bacterium]|nr:HIRAN domain-containing protein [Anaerolineaceae bacterium]
MDDIVKIGAGNIGAILKGEGPAGLGHPFANPIYLIDIHIAGTTYVLDIDELEPDLKIGQKLKFYREPQNMHDPLAILIRDDEGNKLGYVPKKTNPILSRLMDAGKILYGIIREKEYVDTWLKIMVQVYLDD